MNDSTILLSAMEMFKAYEGKPVTTKGKDSEAKESWRGKPPVPILMGASSVARYSEYLENLSAEGDLNDEELLKKFAEQVLTYIKQNQPQLLKELKVKYFEGIE